MRARRKIIGIETLEGNFILAMLKGFGDGKTAEMLKRNPRLISITVGREVTGGEERRVIIKYEVDRKPSHPEDQCIFLSLYKDFCEEHGLAIKTDSETLDLKKQPLRIL